MLSTPGSSRMPRHHGAPDGRQESPKRRLRRRLGGGVSARGSSVPMDLPTDAEIVAENVATIAALEEQALAHRSFAERLADHIARMTGTLWFALVHAGWFGAWLLINVGLTPGLRPFDPFPFSFL